MRHRPPPPGNRRVPYRVDVSDGTGPLADVLASVAFLQGAAAVS